MSDQLNQAEEELKIIWESIRSYLERDLGLIWTEEVEQKLKKLKTELEQVEFILNRLKTHYSNRKDKKKYSIELRVIDDMKSKLDRIKSNRRWVKGMTRDVTKLIETERRKMPTRRGFLKRIAAAAAGLALGWPRKARAAGLGRPRVDFFVVSMKNSFYSKGGYDLARDYLRKEVGIDAHFHFCKEKDLPADLDHRKRLVIHEMDGKRYRKELSRYKYYYESSAVGIMEEKRALLNHDSHNRAAHIKEELEHINEEREKIQNNTSLSEGRREILLRRLDRDEKRNILESKEHKQYVAKHLVHEIGHLFGLWHSFQYTNDGLDDFIDKKTVNAMSYEKPKGYGVYGFDLTPAQKKHIISFLSGGEVYKEIEKCRFMSAIYFAYISRKNGYKFAPGQ